jgi:hypothetical protein
MTSLEVEDESADHIPPKRVRSGPERLKIFSPLLSPFNCSGPLRELEKKRPMLVR